MEKRIPRRRGRSKLLITKTQAALLMKSIFTTIAEALERGEPVSIARFGKFFVRKLPAGTKIVHPRTKEIVHRRPDRLRTVRFRPSRALLDRVNHTPQEQ